jgi:heat shock protein HtpX
MGHRHFNGLKTTALFGVLWVVLLALGASVGRGRYIFLFAGLGVVMTAYSYWNSGDARGPRERARAAGHVPDRA